MSRDDVDLGDPYPIPGSSQDLKDLANSSQPMPVWHSRPRLWGCIWFPLGNRSPDHQIPRSIRPWPHHSAFFQATQLIKSLRLEINVALLL